jgi:DNA-binding NtrC family response regulator
MQKLPILVVDDEAEMLTTLLRTLSRRGFSVEGASNGAEALHLIKRKSFSLVITDFRMPQMSGIELLQNVKKLTPDIPVIMITGYGTVNNAVEAMQHGAADYLLKPFSSQTLQAAIKKVGIRPNGNGRSKTVPAGGGFNSAGKKIITEDPKLLKLLTMAKSVAPSKATVLIQGESGTGKELLAAYIHRHSSQQEKTYMAVNCAALPDTLAESELFGHEKGAFTGAVSRKTGKFELAADGTLVMDEISEMTLPLQAKILRVLQERHIDRVGGGQPIPIDARIIAISNVDLKTAVKNGKFREDLFFRVNVVPLTIPPLRERKSDIPLLANHFLGKFSAINNKEMTGISDNALAILINRNWRGNIRELENAIERAVLLGSGETLQPQDLLLDETGSTRQSPVGGRTVASGQTVKEMEKRLIFKTLQEVNENRTHASELLGISIRTLRNKLREYRQENAPGS